MFFLVYHLMHRNHFSAVTNYEIKKESQILTGETLLLIISKTCYLVFQLNNMKQKIFP